MLQFSRPQENPLARAIWVFALISLCAVAAQAQLAVGDNIKMNLDGSLGYGYNGSFGNLDTGSSHGSGLTGNGNLTGYYFHPNFLSFQFRPYYQRNQTNTDSEVINNGTGFGGSVSLFGGSRFPGSISFGQDFSSNSQFRIGGVDTVSANSSGSSFGVTWSAIVPDYPRLTVSWAKGSSSSDYLGGNSDNRSTNLNINTSYRTWGFDLQGFYSRSHSELTTPIFLTGTNFSNDSTSSTYGASAQHNLPLRGSFGINWSHSNLDSSSSSNFSSDSVTAGTTFNPWHRFSIYQNVSYTSNLIAAYSLSVLNGNNAATLYFPDRDSHGVFYTTGATFMVGHGFNVSARYNHRKQWFLDEEYEDSQYSVNVAYNNTSRLFGFLYFGIGATNTYSEQGNEGGGLTANLGMSKKFGRWDTSADFSYAQNVQTLAGIKNTSNYSYGGSFRRRFNDQFAWNGAIRAAHSGLTNRDGDSNRAESASTGFIIRKYSFSTSYAQSQGVAVLTANGDLTPTPVGSILTPQFYLFNARSFAVNGSTRLFRRFSVSSGYAKFTSSTSQTGSTGTNNLGRHYYFQADYRLRKFYLLGGYGRTNQSVSVIPGGPRVVNSYYLSLSRWFNVF